MSLSSHQNNATFSTENSLFNPLNFGRSGSVLDNKETFVQFCASTQGSKSAKDAFIKVSHRHRNLTLSNWLEESEKKEEIQVNKTIRRLRFCSSVSTIVESNTDVEIFQTSKSCKSSHCSICLRQRSAKISKRIISALSADENQKLFDGKYFYFLTLTVKHDEETRQGIYLKEFKTYTQKLYRSKLWKSYFPYSNKSRQSGWITAYEVTLSEKGGYHIHAHTLICAPKLKIKVNHLQKELSAKWQKLTTDSFMIRLDLLNLKSSELRSDDANKKEVYAAVQELIKYGTKAGSFKNWDKEKSDLYADWIIKTKGANFINASGLFRGLELTGLKSKFDEKQEQQPVPDGKIFIGKTSQLKFNRSTKICHPQHRQDALKKIRIINGSGFIDITEFKEEWDFISMVNMEEQDIKNYVRDFNYILMNKVTPEPEIYVEPLEEKSIENNQQELFDLKPMPRATESQLKDW